MQLVFWLLSNFWWHFGILVAINFWWHLVGKWHHQNWCTVSSPDFVGYIVRCCSRLSYSSLVGENVNHFRWYHLPMTWSWTEVAYRNQNNNCNATRMIIVTNFGWQCGLFCESTPGYPLFEVVYNSKGINHSFKCCNLAKSVWRRKHLWLWDVRYSQK